VALLLNVHIAGRRARQRADDAHRAAQASPDAIRAADVRQYGAMHPAFPQEGTADQFFDEAQWESYRALGVAIGASPGRRRVAAVRPAAGCPHGRHGFFARRQHDRPV
jgi:hypothetical protein